MSGAAPIHETGIPLPATRGHKQRTSPLYDIGVGESVFFPGRQAGSIPGRGYPAPSRAARGYGGSHEPRVHPVAAVVAAARRDTEGWRHNQMPALPPAIPQQDRRKNRMRQPRRQYAAANQGTYEPS